MLFTTMLLYRIAFVPFISFCCWIKLDWSSQIHFILLILKKNCSVVHKSRAVRKTIITSLSTIPQFLIMSKESCVYDSKTDVNVYHTVTFLNSHDSSRWFINVKVEGFIYLSESLTISFKRSCIMTRLIYIYVDIHVCRLEVRVTQTVLSLFWCYDEMHLSPLQLNCRCIFFFDVFFKAIHL